MFGYIVIQKPELKIKDFEAYNAFYCGLCKTLKKRHGISGQAALNYDLTMILLLLTGLYEPETDWGKTRCFVHPLGNHAKATNLFSAYCADMNILLADEKLKDDVADEKKISARLYHLVLKRKARKVRAIYPEKAAVISDSLKELAAAEKRGETNLDLVSGCFGKILATVCCYKDDVWTEELNRFGFFLGKFIYLLDAYDDLSRDLEKGCYNPLIPLKDDVDFEEKIQRILEMMMSEAAKAFEILPIVTYSDILKNILYGGVWLKYYARRKKDQKTDDE